MENNSKIVSAGLVCLLHEMNNPLTSIKLCLELLPTADEDAKEEYYTIIRKSTDQLQNTVHEISGSFLNDGFFAGFHLDEEISMKDAPSIILE